MTEDPIEQANILDEDERQSIREWFRRLARHRGPTGTPEPAASASEEQADDLPLPPELAFGVRGGAQSGQSSPPDEPADEPEKR